MFDFDVRSGRASEAAENGTLTKILVDLSSDPLRPGLLRAGGPPRDEFSECVAQIPRRPPVVVGPSSLVKTALGLMTERPGSAVLVGSHGVLLGMLSALDVLQRMLDSHAPLGELPVSSLMESRPQTLLEGDSIGYAVRKLWTLGGRPMPIVQPSGAFLGLLETQDVLAWWLCDRSRARSMSIISSNRRPPQSD
jgi:CBS domain-containing protein